MWFIILPHGTNIVGFAPLAPGTKLVLKLFLKDRLLRLMRMPMQHKSHVSVSVIKRDKVVAQDQLAFNAVSHDHHLFIIFHLTKAALIRFTALIMISPDQMDKPVHLTRIL